MKLYSLLFAIFLSFGFQVSAQDVALLLYDGETGRTFAGCLNCNRYDDAAVCNKYGTYGSKYEDHSIWNKYGEFGSKYEESSPWNSYGEGLRVVDPYGNFYGHFSLNSYPRGGQSNIELVQALINLYEHGVELDAIRNLLCEN